MADEKSSETARLFCEMFHFYNEPGVEGVWKEKVRWLKFEEKVEDGGGVFSQPHVAALNSGAMQELKELMEECTVLMDCEVKSFEELVFKMVEHVKQGDKEKINTILNAEKVTVLSLNSFLFWDDTIFFYQNCVF